METNNNWDRYSQFYFYPSLLDKVEKLMFLWLINTFGLNLRLPFMSIIDELLAVELFFEEQLEKLNKMHSMFEDIRHTWTDKTWRTRVLSIALWFECVFPPIHILKS